MIHQKVHLELLWNDEPVPESKKVRDFLLNIHDLLLTPAKRLWWLLSYSEMISQMLQISWPILSIHWLRQVEWQGICQEQKPEEEVDWQAWQKVMVKVVDFQEAEAEEKAEVRVAEELLQRMQWTDIIHLQTGIICNQLIEQGSYNLMRLEVRQGQY